MINTSASGEYLIFINSFSHHHGYFPLVLIDHSHNVPSYPAMSNETVPMPPDDLFRKQEGLQNLVADRPDRRSGHCVLVLHPSSPTLFITMRKLFTLREPNSPSPCSRKNTAHPSRISYHPFPHTAYFPTCTCCPRINRGKNSS